MTRERPILFSAPMVRALMSGLKTQTRRVFKVRSPDGKRYPVTSPDEEILRFTDGSFHYLSTAALSGPYPCPYGSPGDLLWVRETFAHDGIETLYAADCADADLIEGRKLQRQFPGLSDEYPAGRWKPSIHMPRRLSRITLRITDVRVQRLQDITPEDAIAEGVSRPDSNDEVSAVDAYRELWLSINGAGSWEDNLWVWVIDFERLQQMENAA